MHNTKIGCGVYFKVEKSLNSNLLLNKGIKMKAIRFLKESNEDVSEQELQSVFEKNLGSLGDWGLRFVKSFVPIGTGTIDILAIDNDNDPVIIECKKIGKNFDKDALIQLMRYYSWFRSNENNIRYIKDIIKKELSNEIEINNNLSLVAIVGEVSDDVKNACWALDTSIMLVTYSLIEDSGGSLIVVPKIILDTSIGGEKSLSEPKNEQDHLKGHENLKTLYEELKKKILEIDPKIKINPSPQDYIGFKAKNTFVAVHLKRNWIRIDLPLSSEEVKSDKYTWKEGWGWGYVHITSVKEIDEFMPLIKKSYDKSL